MSVLVLHGSPGSGKTTLSRAVAECLRTADMAHAVIDLDDLSMVYPGPNRSFAHENLKAIWPNYAAVPDVKLVISSVIADEEDLELLRVAVPGAKLTVCELTAPEAVLKDRVTAREPNEYWQSRLRDFVDLYHGRIDLATVRDFRSRLMANRSTKRLEKSSKRPVGGSGLELWRVTTAASPFGLADPAARIVA